MRILEIIDAIRAALKSPGKAEALAGAQTTVAEQDPQRAMLASVKRELAEHPSKGLTPARLYAILEAAEAGDLKAQHALFADMEEKDPQIQSDLGKRKQAAAELEWQIVPPDNASRGERKAADQAREAFDALEVEDLVIDLGDGIGHGWVNLEIPWGREGALRVFDQPIWRPHAWFQTPPEQYDTITLRDGSMDGEALWPLGWVQHRHRAKSGYVSRLGLHRTLVWPYLFQSYALGDLAELLEILGIPARLGKYPATATADERSTLLNAVTQLGHSAAGIIPEGMAIEYLEAAKADGATHEVMLRWCERAKSKAILGGTLATGEGQGSGSYAQAKVHERSFDKLVAADARQYAATIRRDLLWPMAALNFGIERIERSPRWYLDLGEVEDYEILSKALPVFVDYGARIPIWWLHEKTRIPQAGDADAVLGRAAPAVAPVDADQGAGQPGAMPGEEQAAPAVAPVDADQGAGQHGAMHGEKQAAPAAEEGVAAARALARRGDGGDVHAQAQIDALGGSDPGWDAAMAPLLAPIWEALEGGLTPEEILARMDEWYPEMDDGQLADILARGIASAETLGRLEAPYA